jgi:hypothetical protein
MQKTSGVLGMSLQGNFMKIIAFGNSRYKRIAHNWALYLDHHKINNYTIYSLDENIYEYLAENKINTELLDLNIFNGKEWEKWAWGERMKFIHNLLNQGMDVLHSDLDAIWLKNPLGFITGEYDIISSIGTFPSDIYKKIGYTLCMGWAYYKSCQGVKELFNNILDKHEDRGFDDQIAFNRELFFDLKYSGLKVKALSQSIVSRTKPHDKETYVAHPHSKKTIDREQFLKNKKLWGLE